MNQSTLILNTLTKNNVGKMYPVGVYESKFREVRAKIKCNVIMDKNISAAGVVNGE